MITLIIFIAAIIIQYSCLRKVKRPKVWHLITDHQDIPAVHGAFDLQIRQSIDTIFAIHFLECIQRWQKCRGCCHCSQIHRHGQETLGINLAS